MLKHKIQFTQSTQRKSYIHTQQTLTPNSQKNHKITKLFQELKQQQQQQKTSKIKGNLLGGEGKSLTKKKNIQKGKKWKS